MTSVRQFRQSPIYQGENEAIAYSFSTAPWGVSAPTNVLVAVYRGDGATWSENVTVVVMPAGSPTVSGSVITLPLLRDLQAPGRYRVEVQFDGQGNTFEAWAEVIAEK